MRALPRSLQRAAEPEISGLSCPECFGVLTVAIEGSQDLLHFRCRTGHAYSADEVIVGKEQRLEEHLRATLTILDELIAFLRELRARGGIDVRSSFADRVAQAVAQRDGVRVLLDGLEPTVMRGDGIPDDPAL